MKRFLSWIKRGIVRPERMDLQTSNDSDPIRELGRAVRAHKQSLDRERVDYDERTRAALDDLIKKMGRESGGESRADA